ncbi:hypothetical protein DPSP01_014246, partial [Paraphaeosphaeria sporulosa]
MARLKLLTNEERRAARKKQVREDRKQFTERLKKAERTESATVEQEHPLTGLGLEMELAKVKEQLSRIHRKKEVPQAPQKTESTKASFGGETPTSATCCTPDHPTAVPNRLTCSTTYTPDQALGKPFPLTDLPEELVSEIAQHLDGFDLDNLTMVSKAVHALISGLWCPHARLDAPDKRMPTMQTCPQLPPTMATWLRQWKTLDPLVQHMVTASPSRNIFSESEMAPIKQTVGYLRRTTVWGADYMGAWEEAKGSARSAELHLPAQAYDLVIEAMLKKVRNHMNIHCPEEATGVLDEAVAFVRDEPITMPYDLFRGTMRHALVSVAARLPYTRSVGGFKSASLGAAVVFQISQDAGILLHPEYSDFVQAVQVQASRLYEKNDLNGASAAQALRDQVTSWMDALREGRPIEFNAEKFPTLQPYRP